MEKKKKLDTKNNQVRLITTSIERLRNYIIKFTFVNKLLRFKRLVNIPKPPKLLNTYNESSKGDFNILKNINKLIIIPVIIAIAIIALNFVIFTSIKTQRFDSNDKSRDSLILSSNNKNINVVYLGFDDRKNNYKYLDLIVVTSINVSTGSIKSYGINPSFLVNLDLLDKPIALKALYNNVNDNKMLTITNAIESLIAIRIDRYVAFNYTSVGSIIRDNSINLKTTIANKTLTTFYSKGQNLTNNQLIDYLFNNEILTDQVVENYTYFINTLMLNMNNPIYLYKEFINNKNILNNLYTNFSSEELINYIRLMSSSPKRINSSILSVKFADEYISDDSKLQTIMDKGLNTNDLLLDEDIDKVFSEEDILKEQPKIEIYNSSNISRLAYIKKRAFEHLGATVVKYSNYPINLENNTLYLPKNNPKSYSLTIGYINDDLRGKLKIILGEYKYNYSGDLILILGSNDN